MSSCDDILKKSRAIGLDQCEAISLDKKITTIRITDSSIAEIKQNQDNSVATRIIHNKKIMSAKTFSGNTENILKKIIDTESKLEANNFWKSLPLSFPHKSLNGVYDPKLANISTIKAVEIAQDMINSAMANNISRISGSLNIVSERFHIMNTNGLDKQDNSTFISGTINTESDTGNLPVSGIGAVCCRTLTSFDSHKVGEDSMSMCLDSINPKSVESDSYDIIFEPYAFGELLAFVFSNNFSLKAYSEKRSCFSGMKNSQIARENFSLIDDPHVSEGIGSKSFDDEGTITRPRFLIKSGNLENLYSDSFEAFKNKTDSSGNACRLGSPMGRSAQPLPTALPHNLRVPNGQRDKSEIIANTKKGLLVGRLWYTYPVNPERGDFSCTARSGIRLIENGKIISPAKSVRIVYNLKLLLQNITDIANDAKNILQWSSIPAITPTVKVDNIRVVPIN